MQNKLCTCYTVFHHFNDDKAGIENYVKSLHFIHKIGIYKQGNYINYEISKCWLASQEKGSQSKTLQAFSNSISSDTWLAAGVSVSRKAMVGWRQLGKALLGRTVIQGLLAGSISSPHSAHIQSPARHSSHRMIATNLKLCGVNVV